MAFGVLTVELIGAPPTLDKERQPMRVRRARLVRLRGLHHDTSPAMKLTSVGHARHNCASDAQAWPPLMSGTITNSGAATPSSSTT